MPFVMGLCQKIVVLHRGAVLARRDAGGDPRQCRVLDAYLGS